MNQVLISAHRGGFEGDTSIENSPQAIARSVELKVDFVEIDVQRTLDGYFVIAHDDYLPNRSSMQISAHTFSALKQEEPNLLTLHEALLMMKGRVGAHIDLKFKSPTKEDVWEETLVQNVIDILQGSDFILTTLEDSSVLRMRTMLQSLGRPEILVGLSLGRDVSDLNLFQRVKTRLSEVIPGRRIKRSKANLVVSNYKLAKISVLAWAQRASLPTLIWTVDEPEDINFFLSDKRVWMITTNFPRLALDLRKSGSKAKRA